MIVIRKLIVKLCISKILVLQTTSSTLSVMQIYSTKLMFYRDALHKHEIMVVLTRRVLLEEFEQLVRVMRLTRY